MKTLLFTLEYPPFRGGVANYYGNLAKYWPIDEKILVLENSRGEIISRSGFLSWWPAIFTLKRKLIKDNIDYLLVGQILPLGTVSYIVSWLRPTKYAVFLHGMDLALALRMGRRRFISRLILKRADKIICANSYVQEKLFEFCPELKEKTTIINPGIESGVPDSDQNELREIKKNYNLEGKTVLLSLGRLVKRKGVDRTIEALAHIPEETSNKLIYFVAGVGPREEYLKKLVPLNFSKKIIFLGEVTESDKWAWLKLCDIFIMPSRDILGDFEGFGIVYLEANLCGKPVIAGNSGGVRDAVIDQVTGLMVNPEKPDEVGQMITYLANNPELRDKLGRQGRERALREFNWEKQAQRVWQFIK